MTTASKTARTPSIGRVVFYPEAGKQYLFFHPSSVTPALKVLDGSMWFSKQSAEHGEVYRAAACVEALHWLKDNLGQFTVSKEVHAWYQAEISIQPLIFPEELPLYSYQKTAIQFLTTRNQAMLSLSPGLGKTLVSSYAASLGGPGKVLVVAPLSLLYMWQAELRKWIDDLPIPPVVQIWHKTIPTNFKLPEDPEHFVHWVISNPETVVRNLEQFKKQKFDLIILDESILYKNRKAQRTKKLTELANSIPRKWLLTGAPASRMLDDLWAQFHLLRPKTYTSYWRFAKEYCIVDETPWGAKVATNKLGAEEKIKERFKDIYFARSQEEVLDIPDWLFEDIDVPMTSAQEKVYRDLKETLIAKLEGESGQTVVRVSNHLAMVVNLIQAASNPLLIGGKDSSGKWEAIPELLSLYPAPYILWTTFIESAKNLTEKLRALGLKAEYMLGETPSDRRQELVDCYQGGKLDALVLGQAVGSFGLTLTAGRTAIYVERNFDGSYFQSLHRFRRIGTAHSPNVLHLRSTYATGEKTIDHVVHGMLDYRVNMVKQLTVGMLEDI